MKTINVIGLPVAVTTYKGAIEWIFEHARKGDRAYPVEAANTHVAALARHDKEFGEVMAKFDLICPDGMPLVWSVNRGLKKQLPVAGCQLPGGDGDDEANHVKKLTDRVYGPTLMLECIEASQGQPDLKHFLFGGKQSTLDKLNKKFTQEYPTANIAGSYSPPFGEWPEGELEKICGLIKESGANHIWVGLGCPKQEKWMVNHKDILPPGCYFGVGAAFAFHAGEVPQAPSIFQKFGMEWFYRMIKEPRRLFKRYFTYNTLFIYYSLRDRMKDY